MESHLENSKYYIPEISEFHVGFECELKNSSHPVNFEWEKFKIIGVDDGEISGRLMDWSFYNSKNAISDESIRVKYLDQSDIESLGWVIRDFHADGSPMLMGGTEIYFYKENKHDREIEFRFSIKGNYSILIFTNKENWIDYEKYSTLFQGTIKNKSELIKLMQQLNIK